MNHLAGETSPYLLQHRDNPVDWYPWGNEALERSAAENRPLLVSIGYSACHWCHVMAHESFEDPEIAGLMNREFVCIKVDREERPDIDAVCMDACQAINGHGGWPLNVFLTPEQQPFYAGTYFPPADRPGIPSWRLVLEALAEAWRDRPQEILDQGAALAAAITRNSMVSRRGELELPESAIADSVEALRTGFDERHGGWGGAPKFPPHTTLEMLLAAGEHRMSLATLRAMASGGIYDQLAGGFARYAVDATWTVPHFEKMLYDNALLARTYVHAWQISGEERFRAVCEGTLNWALRELQGPEGGFCSALDADSEGVEGRFYVWTPDQIRAALADLNDDGLVAEALAFYGVTDEGTFEDGQSVLEARGPRPPADRLELIRERLLDERSKRVRPGLDDKRLTGWNALMIMALADAGAALNRPDYVDAARDCAIFLLEQVRDERGLLRTWKDGSARLAAQLEDHAYLLQALLLLYEATFDERFYLEAITTAEAIIERFGDPALGGFFTTASDQPHLVARRKDMQDAPLPSGNSAAALGLLRLSRLSGETRYAEQAAGVLALHGEMAMRHPSAFAALLQALDLYLSPSREVAIVGGSGAGPLTGAVRERFTPHVVLAGADDATGSSVPLLSGRTGVDGHAAAYVCESFSCQLPVSERSELETLLESFTSKY